jgi:hypothetical protein
MTEEVSRRTDLDYARDKIMALTRDLKQALAEQDRLVGQLDALHSWQGLMSLLDEHWPAEIFKGSSGDPGPTIVFLVREVDRLRREVEFEANALETHGEWFGVDEPERVCACISDDQASTLAASGALSSGRPAFTRPVCAVHAGAGGWRPGDPIYPDECEASGGGACSDPDCGVTWSPAGPTECPRCGSPAIAGTPWAEDGDG